MLDRQLQRMSKILASSAHFSVEFLSFSDILQIAAAGYDEALIFLQEFTCYKKEKDIDQCEKGEDCWSSVK